MKSMSHKNSQKKVMQNQTMPASDDVLRVRRPALIEDEEQQHVIGVNVL